MIAIVFCGARKALRKANQGHMTANAHVLGLKQPLHAHPEVHVFPLSPVQVLQIELFDFS
jgi:hypothetical protein